MTNLTLSRRGFLAGLSSLLAAPAVVRAEALMPIKVWRPPLIWRDGMIACNGVERAGFENLNSRLSGFSA